MNSGARLHEGAKINRSLLALANCINALTSQDTHQQQSGALAAAGSGGGGGGGGVRRGSTGSLPGSVVNYRDSKLTHLLKSSLEGHCRMIMIANINPNGAFYEDSHNTLKYANRAKAIKVRAEAREGGAAVAGSGAAGAELVAGLQRQLGDTAASRARLEEEVRMLRAQLTRGASMATLVVPSGGGPAAGYTAPPAAQVNLARPVFAAGARGGGGGDYSPLPRCPPRAVPPTRRDPPRAVTPHAP